MICLFYCILYYFFTLYKIRGKLNRHKLYIKATSHMNSYASGNVTTWSNGTNWLPTNILQSKPNINMQHSMLYPAEAPVKQQTRYQVVYSKSDRFYSTPTLTVQCVEILSDCFNIVVRSVDKYDESGLLLEKHRPSLGSILDMITMSFNYDVIGVSYVKNATFVDSWYRLQRANEPCNALRVFFVGPLQELRNVTKDGFEDLIMDKGGKVGSIIVYTNIWDALANAPVLSKTQEQVVLVCNLLRQAAGAKKSTFLPENFAWSPLSGVVDTTTAPTVITVYNYNELLPEYIFRVRCMIERNFSMEQVKNIGVLHPAIRTQHYGNCSTLAQYFGKQSVAVPALDQDMQHRQIAGWDDMLEPMDMPSFLPSPRFI